MVNRLLLLMTFWLVLMIVSAPVLGQSAYEISVKRLTWAGVQIVSGNTTLLIDAVGKDLWNGNAPGGLVPVEVETFRVYALITHAHNDHFDLETLKEVLGEKGYAIVAESEATYVASRGLRVIPAKPYVPVSRGGFVITALPAVDGFGDQQVSWLVTKGDKRIFHGGDTLWHGSWKMFGNQFGEVDIAFLPINGVVVGGDPTMTTPAVMTPSQAVDAARFLKTKTMVPIHYGLNDPPYYVEAKDALETAVRRSKERDVHIQVMKPGDVIKLD